MKQIRNGDLVSKLIDDGNGYFHWLQKKSGLSGPLSSMLAETQFISLYKLDDILLEKAKEETRRQYAEEVCENAEDVETVYKSIRGDCCLFEVMLCLANTINEMFEDFNAFDGCSHFFGIMLTNACFDRYDEEDWDMREEVVKAYWQKRIDILVKREYGFYGEGGLFPVNHEESYKDRRDISLWQQMNDWVDQHTNEDGEWVD